MNKLLKYRAKNWIKKLFFATGFQITRYPIPQIQRRLKLIEAHGIDTLLDVGANVGQYSNNMRIWGFKGKIVSFEPLTSAFAKLSKLYAQEPNRILKNYALGEADYTTKINIAGNSVSSSILSAGQNMSNLLPQMRYVSSEDIEVKALDSIFDEFVRAEVDSVMLKIDAQGYEKNVILGAEKSLSKIKLIQMEMSITPLYQSEIDFFGMIDLMEKRGFRLVSVEDGIYDEDTGYLIELDGLFINTKFEIKH